MKKKRLFITFEGSEGSGKSTQADLAYKFLTTIKPVDSLLLLREPGGVVISEAIRKIILDGKNTRMTRECETLLYMAARAQLVEEKLLPALSQGKIVLCDRFLDSTLAYQGYGNGVDLEFIKSLGRSVTQGIVPHLTFLFDIDVEEGLRRRGGRRDRIEQRPLTYHRRVRRGYLQLAQEAPERFKVIKVNQGKEAIHEIVRRRIEELV